MTGIYPLDENIFTDEDFLPASVTEQEMDDADENDEDMHRRVVFEVEAGPHINDEINYDDNSEIMNVSDASNTQDSQRTGCSGVGESQDVGCSKAIAEEIPEQLSATLPSDIIPLPILTKKRK
ncbi:unnamed protein product [Ceutorhynchus assimilis]|uniref:Uncharacterized protein n=1 Tax=Ceutorhynchus assimilis TaxID=467358 RepID=A0A9N9QLS0_9CUCU|nr:unnamed protein product [Ceutorhynchus assimilis]